MKSKIKNINAREILDSRGNPTVEVELETGSDIFKSSSPSGASTGKYEAVELRDGGQRYQGKGVLKAVENVKKIIRPALLGKDSRNQTEIDKIMLGLDGTENKSNLGANAILPVSQAVCRAGAAADDIPLYKHISQLYGSRNHSFFNIFKRKNRDLKIPTPSILLVEGGLHAGNKLYFQEFMILCWADTFKEKLRKGVEIYQRLGKLLERQYDKSAINIGFEGGYAAPMISETKELLDLIKITVDDLGFQNDVRLAIDCAASIFYRNNTYNFEGQELNRGQMLNLYQGLCQNYSIYSLEDPYSEEDYDGFKEIRQTLGKSILIVGDDLLTTNTKRISLAIRENLCDGLLLKPNQIGTVTESLEAAELAKKANWKIMVSHRSGETNDDFIADFSVGIGADFIKAGAPSRGERMAKYNRLLEIESQLFKN